MLSAQLICAASALATFVLLNDTEAAEHPAQGAEQQRQQVGNVAGHARRVALTDPRYANMPMAEFEVPAGWGYEARVGAPRHQPDQLEEPPLAIEALLQDPVLGTSIHFLPAEVFASARASVAESPRPDDADLTALSAPQILMLYAGQLRPQPEGTVRVLSAAEDGAYAETRARHQQEWLQAAGIHQPVRYVGARVELEITAGGRKLRELLRAVTSTEIDPISGLRTTRLEHIVSLRAPERHMRGLESVASQVIASVQLNPHWAQRALAAHAFRHGASAP